MHFSFPFTAGQYPDARYGHAICKYESKGKEQQVFLIGGMNKVFCTMDIFTLTQITRKDNQKWEKLVQKTPHEELVSKQISNHIYQMRKRKVELYDQMIEEKTLGLEDRRAEEISKKQFDDMTAKFEAEKKARDEEKNKLEQANEGLSEQIKSVLYVLKQEESNLQNYRQKEKLLQGAIEDIFGFMNICDWTIQHDLSRSKLISLLEKLNLSLKTLMERDSAKIDKARQVVKESLLTMKRTYEKSEDFLMEAIKEDEDYSKKLVETYPELKLLDDVRLPGMGEDPKLRNSYSPGDLMSASESLIGL